MDLCTRGCSLTALPQIGLILKISNRLGLVLQALATQELGEAQCADATLDVLTGCHITDGERRLILLEGPADGAMQDLVAQVQLCNGSSLAVWHCLVPFAAQGSSSADSLATQLCRLSSCLRQLRNWLLPDHASLTSKQTYRLRSGRCWTSRKPGFARAACAFCAATALRAAFGHR